MKSPEAVANQFLSALKANNWSRAADLMAWEYIARAQNPDWDSFPSSQRNLIVRKLKEQQKAELQSLAARLGGAETGAAYTNGDMALVQAQAQNGRWTIMLNKGKRGWAVLAVY
jgi:acyl-CoA reductase-like NAD-dependent aldehyde dehydrogenase